MSESSFRYRDSRRRLLLDMHIPDWDQDFLSQFNPASLAEAASAMGADGAMLYFQSHLGLCYWPTKSGVRHAAAARRDLAGEGVTALNAAGIAVCAYYSVNFNNRAWLDHPDWRLQPAAPATIGVLPRERYGIVCLNNREYRAFVAEQIDELVAYPVSAFFFDMMWWNGVCRCPSCRNRYRDDLGAEIPETVDWASPIWTQFQAARERWLTEFAVEVRNAVKRQCPDADVYHNFALGMANWTRGVSFSSAAGHDFLGGDFYGGRVEQLLVTRLMRNLTPASPAEFMTTASASLIDHTRLRLAEELRTKAMAATAADAAFLAIVAIDPIGTIEPEAVNRVGAAFEAAARYRDYAGGEAIEDIAIYFSDASRMSFSECGLPVTSAPASSIPDYPHFHAVAGACRILQQAHLPFGVATRRDLADLARWSVLVLPNILRMDDEEVAAIRAYVAAGGKIYASRGTSLAGTASGLRDDFALADVFGCHFAGEEQGRLIYATAVDWSEPARPLAHWRDATGRAGAVRLDDGAGQPLVGLTLPYGYPAGGAVEDTRWASIHSSPPWQATGRSLVVRNNFERGTAIYSGFDMEAGATPDHDALFISLIQDLLPLPSFAIDTHPAVWATAFHDEEKRRYTLRLLHYPAESPALPVPSATALLRLQTGQVVTAVSRGPEGAAVSWSKQDGGVLIEAGPIDGFAMLAIEYEV